MFVLLIYIVVAWCSIKDFDYPMVFTGLLGLYLLLCVYAAVGLFMSSLTSYQVVAAMLTLTILGVLNYVGSMWQDVEFVREITYWLSISGRANEFIRGLICSEDLTVFYHRDSYVSDFSDDPFASRSAETTVDKNIWTVSRGDHGY